jgi:hypothetical protein
MRSISELDTSDPDCPRCEGIGWVCENHPAVPWAGMTGEPTCRGNEGCGGAGMPCPDCNELARAVETLKGAA